MAGNMLLKVVALGFLVFIILGCLSMSLIFKQPKRPKVQEDGFFGISDTEREAENKIDTVKITIPDHLITDCKERLEKTRYFGALPYVGFTYGFNPDYMKQVVEFWLKNYDWRDSERILNRYEHFMSVVEGVKIHMMRAPPPAGKAGTPLLMIHGWPSSVYEFHKVLPMLTNPSTVDKNPFDVYLPSLPGYGFSLTPARTGMSPRAMARIFHKYMHKLKITKYYVHGTDFGSIIGQLMAQMYPEEVLGFHANMFPVDIFYNANTVLKTAVSMMFPSYLMSPPEMRYAFNGDRLMELLEETGYMHIQATKPDTVSHGLNDSPVGLAAYIMEKYAMWTNRKHIVSKDGGMTAKITMNDLLTQVMIYYTNGNIAPSLRLYKETFLDSEMRIWERLPVTVPTGLTAFPEEIYNVPHYLAAEKFTNLVQYTLQPRGGHFPALEEPELLVEDIFMFVERVEESRGTKKEEL